ncbi:MAG: oxygen-independent coproporphyrinogen III oxidase [Opitutales bacterium]
MTTPPPGACIDDTVFALIRKYDRPGPRYTSYPPANHFSPEVDPARLIAASAESTSPLSLYLHIPFCESLCWFCGCHTTITLNRNKAQHYLDHLFAEIAQTADRLQPGRLVDQVHLGGGTPNFLTPEQIRRLAGELRQHFTLTPDAEISAELDPRILTEAHIEALRELGLNRASFGVQDSNPDVQKAVHRVQPPEMNERAMQWLREAGIGSVNIDLIYGLPLQTPEGFRATLREVQALGPDRFAVFNYAHVPWMKPAQKLLERHPLPQGDEKLTLLQTIVNELTAGGFVYVGMDHFAKPDDELVVAQRSGTLQRNFQGYSTRAGAEILGLGISSISQTADTYRQNHKELPVYQKAITEGEAPVSRGFMLSREDQLRREVIMEIMCNLHLPFGSLAERWQLDPREHFAPELEALQPMADDGLVEIAADGLHVTERGRWFLRNLAMPFDQYLANAPGRYSRTV